MAGQKLAAPLDSICQTAENCLVARTICRARKSTQTVDSMDVERTVPLNVSSGIRVAHIRSVGRWAVPVETDLKQTQRPNRFLEEHTP